MPPDNTSFMVAAYVVAAVILLGYTISLLARIREQRRRD
jgi:hypothetical protein